MNITTAARRITRTINEAARGPRDWEIYFDAHGHEVHRHATTAFDCDVQAAHRFDARRVVTQAEIQEELTPEPLPVGDPEFDAAFMGSYA